MSNVLKGLAFAIIASLLMVAVTVPTLIAFADASRQSPHTWVDDEPIAYSVDEMLGRTGNRQFSNIDPPIGWVGTANKGSVIRLLTDKITGDQVQIVNGGWRDGNRVMYRILRRVRIDYSDYDSDKGWTEDRNRIADFWTTEERSSDELAKLPGA